MSAYLIPITVWPCGSETCSSRAVVEVYGPDGSFEGRFCKTHGARMVATLNRRAAAPSRG